MAVLAFDIDGTIYDAGNILFSAFEKGIASFIKKSHHNELTIPDHDAIMAVVGIPIGEIFTILFPSLTTEEKLQLNNLCTDYLVEAIEAKEGIIFSDVAEILKQLYEGGHKIHVASNGRKEYIEAILQTYDLMKYFSSPFVYLNDQIDDKTAIVSTYIDTFGDDIVIMVGDRFTDREAAEKNNIPFIACEFGHGADELEGCRYIVKSFSEIPEMIKKIEGEG